MSELVKIQSISKLNEDARAENSSLDNLRVLVDHSGSMAGTFASGGSKISAAQKAIETLWTNTDWGICDMKVFAFDDYPKEIQCSDAEMPVIPQPSGGTDFSAAINIATQDLDTNRIILCSDGESSFPDQQIAVCVERAIPIDTIFIKDSGDTYATRGEALLRQISEETGGQFCTVENTEDLVTAFAQLETTERLLLSHDPEVIEL